jgi:hypothetical protein
LEVLIYFRFGGLSLALETGFQVFGLSDFYFRATVFLEFGY